MDFENLCKGCFSEKGNQEECPHCHFQEDSTQEIQEASIFLAPGTILFDKYIIGNVLGQGGFGITYLGWDTNLDIKIAIKEFFPRGLVSRLTGQNKVITFSEAEKETYKFGLDRFLKEAKTIAQFEHHPNIVSVRDFFKANNTAYIIMSYYQGISFEKYIKQNGGKISFDKTLDIIMPVMDALKEVHKIGVIHRDISPDNILIDSEGRVILIDFGSARQALRDKSKSLSVILKAGYAPEEQYRSRGEQGAWTDIYAVASTIYRAVTGEVPPESIDRLNKDTLVAPSELGVEINKKQEATLIKALAVKYSKRFSKVEEFQEALIKAKKDKAVQEPNIIPVKAENAGDVKLKTPSLLVAGFIIFLLMIYGGFHLFSMNMLDILNTEETAGAVVNIEEDEDNIKGEIPFIDAQMIIFQTIIKERELSISDDHNEQLEPEVAEESPEADRDSGDDSLIEPKTELDLEQQQISEPADKAELELESKPVNLNEPNKLPTSNGTEFVGCGDPNCVRCRIIRNTEAYKYRDY